MSGNATRYALALAPVLVLTAATAFGHPGHDGAGHGGFMAGLSHPLLGVDHLLAMLAVGLWSARQAGVQRRFMPLLVLSGMWLGAALAWGGLALPGVETGIAMSVLLAGVLIATLTRLPNGLGGILVVGFMLFHGYAHGSELPHSASLVTYLLGFSLSTLAITWGGKALGGWLMNREARWSRLLGAAIAVLGGVFTLS
ncbi:HupE/UreJ family protein [Halomonas sp. WWR20]